MTHPWFPVALAISGLLVGVGQAQHVVARTEIPRAAQPHLAAGTDDRVWLVYGHLDETPAPAAHGHGQKKTSNQLHERSGAVFVAESKDGGATFGPAVKVARVPQLMLGMRRGPRIAAHEDRLTVTLIAHELLAFNSSDGGKTWSEPITINEVPASAREGLHDLAGAMDGELFATWLDLRSGKMEIWGASSNNAGLTWGKNQQVYRSPDKSICECCQPTALFDGQGNLAVMWRNSIKGFRDMWLTTRPKGAINFAIARKLGEGTWKLNACPMDGGGIVAFGGGDFGAVWQRAGEVFMTRGNGAELSLGKGKQPVAVRANRDEVIAFWQQGTDLVSLRGPNGGEGQKHAGDARFPSLIALPSGNGTILAYERGSGKSGITVVVERL